MQNDWFKALFKQRLETDHQATRGPFVTISRQAGAGGRTLASAIVAETRKRERLPLFSDWVILDQRVCAAVLEEPGMKGSLQEILAEAYQSPLLDALRDVAGESTSQFTLNKKIFAMMRRAAWMGRVVLVGRAANCVTREIPGGIHLRLVAPLQVREAWMAERFHVDLPEAKRMVQKQDKDRARLLREYFNKDIDDPSLYDAIYDTGQRPMDQIAVEVIDRIQKKGRMRRGA